ncbi:MAG TPA: type II toxin-antitoxin system RelE/ParE family toxin [Candidatus Kapabacteria bacterium]|nr:type II toxin-antitoxin system RelE/ParE family toxin [Candidatus Kapabacteria bacterium]
MTLRPRSEAERDFAEAIAYYITQETPQSARRFKEEVDRVRDLIAEDPHRYPPDNDNLRAWPLDRRFPYRILYTIDSEEEIGIIAIYHNRRSKNRLMRRL